MSPDRNMLFGILAVQMNFIARDALIQAMNAWVLEKDRSLSDTLQEQGKLAPDRTALLDALVNEHLKTHDNDPQKSLAALSSVQSVKEALNRVADATSSNRCDTSLLPANRTFTAPARSFPANRDHGFASCGRTPGAVSARSSSREDAELHREVALKEIQDQHADDPTSRGRFVLEAEITGGLEHPGIVPVYGLGTYADGRPFYAMRFIRGDTPQGGHRALPRATPGTQTRGLSSLAFRELLRRFVDVCNAIAYAHSRGVLHRDLKPGNIMLGKYGETLVVDWGLAKALGRPPTSRAERRASATLRPASGSGMSRRRPASAIGTPAFMSPEQAAGRLDELGPASGRLQPRRDALRRAHRASGISRRRGRRAARKSSPATSRRPDRCGTTSRRSECRRPESDGPKTGGPLSHGDCAGR